MGPSKTWLKELLGTVFNSLILTFSNKCRLWCVNICSGLQKCLPIVRVLRVKNQTHKMRQIGCLCLQAWSVVYFNELLVASRIKKLVEILFCVCFKPFLLIFGVLGYFSS